MAGRVKRRLAVPTAMRTAMPLDRNVTWVGHRHVNPRRTRHRHHLQDWLLEGSLCRKCKDGYPVPIEEYLRRACAIVGVERRALASRTTLREVARAREVIAIVGVERFGVRVGELAGELGMHLGSVRRLITRAAEWRLDDEEFADRCKALERQLGRAKSSDRESNEIVTDGAVGRLPGAAL